MLLPLLSPTSLVVLIGLLLGPVALQQPPSSPQEAPTYVLPYPTGEAYRLLQGYDGPYGHQEATHYAYDFAMEIGSPVVAARDGVVVGREERHEDANRTPGQENYLFIQHDDSTFSRYYHLTKDGALVELGDQVVQGQRIGLSGDTGASAGPHLHFDVTTGCAEWGCQTIPIDFIRVPENPLQLGETYEAQ